jgi:hypothetical protein
VQLWRLGQEGTPEEKEVVHEQLSNLCGTYNSSSSKDFLVAQARNFALGPMLVQAIEGAMPAKDAVQVC